MPETQRATQSQLPEVESNPTSPTDLPMDPQIAGAMEAEFQPVVIPAARLNQMISQATENQTTESQPPSTPPRGQTVKPLKPVQAPTSTTPREPVSPAKAVPSSGPGSGQGVMSGQLSPLQRKGLPDGLALPDWSSVPLAERTSQQLLDGSKAHRNRNKQHWKDVVAGISLRHFPNFAYWDKATKHKLIWRHHELITDDEWWDRTARAIGSSVRKSWTANHLYRAVCLMAGFQAIYEVLSAPDFKSGGDFGAIPDVPSGGFGGNG